MTAYDLYKNYFDEQYERYLAGYEKWKKDRPAKHAETKAKREAKRKVQDQETLDAEYLELEEKYSTSTLESEKKALKRALYSIEVE